MPTQNKLQINIPAPDIRDFQVTIKGTSPLIMNQFSEKSKQQMRDKQAKKAAKGRDVRDPDSEYKQSYYKNSKGDIAFPALCIKNAMIGACRFIEGLPMTVIRGAVFVVGDNDGLVKVKYESERMREDIVRVGMGAADFRYRGELSGWSIPLTIKYNAQVISLEQVISLLQTAGFSQGLGEWRPEKSGDHGTFTVETQ